MLNSAIDMVNGYTLQACSSEDLLRTVSVAGSMFEVVGNSKLLRQCPFGKAISRVRMQDTIGYVRATT